MRTVVLALLVVLPTLAEAQSRRPRPAPPPPEPPASTLPPIGLPLPEIGLPLPPIGLAPPSANRRVERPNPPGRRPPSRPGPPRRGRGPSVIYVPVYPWVDPAATVPDPVEAGPPPAAEPASYPTGTVRLDVEPRGVGEVYVDGYLVGTAEELRGLLTLEPGPHRVEIRAGGYQPLTVDVRVEADGELTLRRELEPVAITPPATAERKPPPSIPRKPFYFIPGCYLGDVPPKEAGLPPGCDISKTTIVKP